MLKPPLPFQNFWHRPLVFGITNVLQLIHRQLLINLNYFIMKELLNKLAAKAGTTMSCLEKTLKPYTDKAEICVHEVYTEYLKAKQKRDN